MLAATPPRPLLLWILVAVGCAGFRPRDFNDKIALYRESLRRLQAGDARNAAAGFEYLTLELSSRDTLITRSYYYLGQAHAKDKSWFEAAKAYNTLFTLFPEDTLVDDAILEAGRAYASIWKDPELDAQYGHAAISMFSTLIENYPNSPLRDEAQAGIDKVREMLAEKDLRIADQQRRRKFLPSANIYYGEVFKRYPETPQARTAYQRMAETFKAMGYTENYRETCELALQRYPDDQGIKTVCNGAGAGVPPPDRASGS